MMIPAGSVPWKLIEGGSDDWVIEETTTGFIAHPTSAKVHEGPVLIEHDPADYAARRWLRAEAEKDLSSLMPCRQCGHTIYEKAEHAPYCGDECRDFQPPE